MAVLDDLRRLASEDVVYLSWTLSAISDMPPSNRSGPTTIWYRGRLRQSTDSGWVFHTYANANGVYGITLGPVTERWSSDEAPGTGITVTIFNQIQIPAASTMGAIIWPAERITISQTPAFDLQN